MGVSSGSQRRTVLGLCNPERDMQNQGNCALWLPSLPRLLSIVLSILDRALPPPLISPHSISCTAFGCALALRLPDNEHLARPDMPRIVLGPSKPPGLQQSLCLCVQHHSSVERTMRIYILTFLLFGPARNSKATNRFMI